MQIKLLIDSAQKTDWYLPMEEVQFTIGMKLSSESTVFPRRLFISQLQPNRPAMRRTTLTHSDHDGAISDLTYLDADSNCERVCLLPTETENLK